MKINPPNSPGEWSQVAPDSGAPIREESVAPPPPSQPPEASKEPLDDETREGLRRLLRLVQKKKSEPKITNRSSPLARKREHFEAYRFHVDAVDPSVQRGQLLNKMC